MKGALLNKMPGDVWQKFANLRALYAYMYGHPGKKLLFMGGELGQWSEWKYAGWLDWHVLNPSANELSPHAATQRLVKDLNHLLRDAPALHQQDFSPSGFEWMDCSDADNSVVAFIRTSADGDNMLLFVCNFTPVARYGYRVGVPRAAYWAEALNTDSQLYGGSNIGNQGGVPSEPIATHGQAQSVRLTLPPLATLIFRAEALSASEDATSTDAVVSPSGLPTVKLARDPSVTQSAKRSRRGSGANSHAISG